MPLLSVRNLQTRFATDRGIVRAVNGVSFDLEEGEVLGLVGESGSGKSVTALSIMRLVPEPPGKVTADSLTLEGTDLLRLSEAEAREIRGSRMAMIFQDPMRSLNPVLTVGRQMTEVLHRHQKLSGAAARRRAIELLETVGIPMAEKRLAAYPHQFSGGMRQRAAIAMALALDPSLLLADEPVTALDVIVQRQILDVLRSLQQRLHLSMVLVTHDISVVAYLCDEVVVMYAGQVVESGPVREVLARPRHPYTMGLRNAFPDLLSDALELVPIAGSPPDLREPLSGCRFVPRCPFAQPACGVEAAMNGNGDHRSACRRDSEADTLRTAALDPRTWQRSSSFAMS